MSGERGKVWFVRGGDDSAGWAAGAGLPELTGGARAGNRDAVLHLGGRRPDASLGGAWHWNANAAEVEALPWREKERRLRREGFVTASSAHIRQGRGRMVGQRYGQRQFRVSVFGLQAADIHPDPGSRTRDEELRRRLARASARALYVLGLDFGSVAWEVNGSGRTGVITGISPFLRPKTAEAEARFAQAASEFASAWSAESARTVSATLGADPEFVLLSDEGKVVPAARYLAPDGQAGCDAVVVGGVQRWALAELRPDPSDDPLAVASQLRRLLASAARRTGGARLQWRAGAAPVPGLPLGGHLHLSGVALTGERLRALDNAVALPLRLLEPPDAGGRRPRYGSLGDYRPKPHGGFEYRTPPSWLVSPRLARGTLVLTKLAAEHAGALAPHRPLDDDAMRDAFYQGGRDRLLAGAERVYAALRGTAGYAKYGAAVDDLFEAIRAGRTWDEGADIRAKWKIPVFDR
ncbi:putative amidoligase domain-containing protein [Cohnella nanjingensis]|uniref:PhiEco32-like amidoligase-type 2 protein n=1 Tax=Cohnella nanjingensis TaxID=1387779 RepID=A0A7X0VCP5_9BACL|nr:hypothetical protein [Cohnella nanjingensis]MBB6669142.1 hypothetical protein [Cohnella nanjingensis]